MWYNGTSLSEKARRALENERVTIVSHISGHIHTIYKEATINRDAYNHFSSKLREFLTSPVTDLVFINFLRFKSKYKTLFQYMCECSGKKRYIALEKIFESVRHITLDPDIDAEHYPNPVLLVETAKSDLLAKYTQNISKYLDFSRYHPGPQFCSVGKKAVYYIREWYIRLIENTTKTVFSEIAQQMTHVIDTAIPSSAGFTTKNITEALDDASDALRNQFTIPFGYDMNLTRYNHQEVVLWNETIRLAVDQYPNYLDPFQITSWGNEELWTLKIRNRCVFGPTGLPLLPPSPVTAWLMTLNLWVIDVQGEYPQFKIIDTSDETIFNPLLGHEPQSYVRELKVISAGNITLGQNTRLTFGFTTVAFGLVPPWGMMLGDIQDNWFDEHTSGFHEG